MIESQSTGNQSSAFPLMEGEKQAEARLHRRILLFFLARFMHLANSITLCDYSVEEEKETRHYRGRNGHQQRLATTVFSVGVSALIWTCG